MATRKITTATKKKLMIDALKKTLGVVSPACENVGISRQTHFEWCRTDERYKKAVEEMDDVGLDYTESKMFVGIKNGDPSLIKFHLSTKGRKRGYGNRTEITGADGAPLHQKPDPAFPITVIAGQDALDAYQRMIGISKKD